MESSISKRHVLPGLALAGAAVAGALVVRRLRLRAWQRRTAVYLNGQRMREGEGNDYVWKGRVPEFDFHLKTRGGACPDVVVFVTEPRRKEEHYRAALRVVGEEEDGEPIMETWLERVR